jgi:hypothetical protein
MQALGLKVRQIPVDVGGVEPRNGRLDGFNVVLGHACVSSSSLPTIHTLSV